MVIPGIYVQGYCMYECTGIQVYSITSGAMALQCITLYKYKVIHQRSFCNLFCGCQLYNPILSIALQVIYNPLQRMASSCVLRMCQMRSKSCNGDGLAMHGRFPGNQPTQLLIFYPHVKDLRLQAVGNVLALKPMRCLVIHAAEAIEASEMPKFAASPFQRCNCPRKDFDAF